MKVFKPIYYSALAILIVLFLTFTAVDFYGVNAKGYIDSDKAYQHVANIIEKAPTRDIYLDNDYHQEAVDYITDFLRGELGFSELNTYTETANEEIVKTSGVVNQPVYSVMQTKVTAQDINKWYAERGKKENYIVTTDVKLTNIVVYIPAKNEVGKNSFELNSDAVLYIVHYDSKSYSPAANNLAIVGGMLEAIRALKDIDNNTNSYVFVFADGGEYGALGAYAFREKYQGFNNVYSRVKAAFAFDSLGSSGALTLIGSNAKASKLAAKWAGVNKKAFATSITQSMDLFKDRIFDYDIFRDIPALNFANIDNPTAENTAADNIDNLNRNLLTQTGAAIVRTARRLADYDLDNLQKGEETVTFSYLGGVVNYSNTAGYVLASLLLVLAGVVFVINQTKKSFSIFDALKGSIVQILAMLITFVLSVGVYYLAGSLLAAMGFLNIHSLSNYLLSNLGMIIGFSFISVAFSMAAFVLLKKLFKIRAADAIRGNIIIWTLLGIILGYAVPKLAYVFLFTAMLELIVVLVMIFVRDKFRQKYSMDFERTLLFLVPMILTIPITFGSSLVLYAVWGFALYPAIMLFTVSAHGFIAPYFNYLAPALDRAAKKLPMRTVRVERVVTERVENKAKKGKFEEKTVKKVFKEKRPREYKNAYGVMFVTLIGFIILFASSMAGQTFGYNYSGSNNYFTKSSLVLVKDNNTTYWMIDDLDFYNKMYFDLSNYQWDAKLRAYKKPVSSVAAGYGESDLTKGNELAKIDNIVTATDGNSKTFTISFPNIQSNNKFTYDASLTNAKNILKIKITTVDNSGELVVQEIPVNTSKSELVIKNLKGQSTITVVGKDSLYSGVVNISAQVSSYQNPNLSTGDFYGFEEWENLKRVAEQRDVDVNVALKIKHTKTI